jgi:hypothetical protein
MTKLNDELENMLVDMYLSGMKNMAICAEVGIWPYQLYAVLEKHGVVPKRVAKRSEAMEAEQLRNDLTQAEEDAVMYLWRVEGLSARQVGIRLRIPNNRVRRILLRHRLGVHETVTGRQPPARRIVSDFVGGDKSVETILEEYGLTAEALYQLLQRAGVV